VFWERFYSLCALNGCKPNPLAKELGISSGVVTKWKTDGTLPNGENLLKIAERLHCSVDYLLGRTDEPGVFRRDDAPLDISEIEFALSGEIRDLSEAEKQDVLDYVRFKRSQKAGAKNDN